MKEKFPDLNFDDFQPFDDDKSTMPADEGDVETLASTRKWTMTPLLDFCNIYNGFYFLVGPVFGAFNFETM